MRNGADDPFYKVCSLEVALSGVQDGAVLLYGGFGGVGSPPLLIQGLLDRGVKDLVAVGNDAGAPDIGIGRLIAARRVRKLISTHVGLNPLVAEQVRAGMLEVEMVPQGTLAERLRAGGAGLSGILLDVGIGTLLAAGTPTLELDGRTVLVERAIRGDISIVMAHKADPFGNLVFSRAARNTNPLVAMAARVTVVQAEEVVPQGSLDPEAVVVPGAFVTHIVTGSGGEWRWRWQA